MRSCISNKKVRVPSLTIEKYTVARSIKSLANDLAAKNGTTEAITDVALAYESIRTFALQIIKSTTLDYISMQK